MELDAGGLQIEAQCHTDLYRRCSPSENQTVELLIYQEPCLSDNPYGRVESAR